MNIGPGNVSHSGVVWNNKIYFYTSYGEIWEYNQQTKILDMFFASNNTPRNCGVFVLNNELYFGSFNENNKTFYKYDIQTKNELKIDNLERKINKNNVQLNSKKYYINDNDNMFYEKKYYNQRRKINNKWWIYEQ